jgi:hypothetical protein
MTKEISAKDMTDGQRAYEAKRAAKAGVSLEKWLAQKERARQEEQARAVAAAAPIVPPKPPGLFKRLLDRAHKPL